MTTTPVRSVGQRRAKHVLAIVAQEKAIKERLHALARLNETLHPVRWARVTAQVEDARASLTRQRGELAAFDAEHGAGR